jgi:DNA-binding Xre family transcriptional regulator
MKKGDLLEQARLNWPTLSKLSKGRTIQTDILDRICAALNCQPGDIMEYIPEQDDSRLEDKKMEC